MGDDAGFDVAGEIKATFTRFSNQASQWTSATNESTFFTNSDNDLTDNENTVILGVAATRAIRQAKVGATRTMIDRTRDQVCLVPSRLAVDKTFGSGKLSRLVGKRIESHIPVIEKSKRPEGTFSNAGLRYDLETDECTCSGANL
ncbi:hypothetical protein [Marimonas arenosa]|uniref:Uncharacterized protein n=1 Tax=Marimonas arenosa TaxID=1795305 RepID=A0AAE3WCB3_9RHOB|nr:hypothetical protein [Marimonas arenosa]MDQ2090087.1 hypothetical protein [Marimonas arenosa]